MTSRGRSRGDDSASGSEYEKSDSPHSDIQHESDNDEADDSGSSVSEISLEGTEDDERLKSRRPREPFFKQDVLSKRRKAKRLKGFYRPKYRELYNSAVHDIVNPEDPTDYALESSTLGVTDWTSAEKAAFFAALSLKGSNARQIADLVVTKSEAEVQDFLDLLHKGLVEENLRPEQYRAVITQDEIPTAVEVSEDCDRAMVSIAERLALKVELADQEEEQRRHGDYWLLTPDVAQQIEVKHHSADPSLDDTGTTNPVPASDILNLPAFLSLASLFQACSADGGTSWVDLIESNDERPSIYHTAFADFHNLALMLTKRLIRASLFQACSRLRATSTGHDHERQLLVRHQDVQAAARILGLKDSWLGYWVHAPRRNGWKIFSRGQAIGDNRNQRAEVLTYDQVETALRKGDADFEAAATVLTTEVAHPPEDIDSDDSLVSDYTDAEAAQDEKLDLETAYLDALDARASKQAEQDLWSIIAPPKTGKRKRGEQPSPPPKVEDDEEPLPPKPRFGRYERAERLAALKNWREDVQWESVRAEPDEEAFADMARRAMRRKKRRLERVEEEDQELVEDEEEEDVAGGADGDGKSTASEEEMPLEREAEVQDEDQMEEHDEGEVTGDEEGMSNDEEAYEDDEGAEEVKDDMQDDDRTAAGDAVDADSDDEDSDQSTVSTEEQANDVEEHDRSSPILGEDEDAQHAVSSPLLGDDSMPDIQDIPAQSIETPDYSVAGSDLSMEL